MPADTLLTATQLAKRLSMKPESILAAARAGRMPSVKVKGSKRVLFRLSDVLEERAATQSGRLRLVSSQAEQGRRAAERLARYLEESKGNGPRSGSANRTKKTARG